MFDLLSRFLVFWARSSLQLCVCSSFYVFVSIYPFSSDATVVKIAITFVFSCWKLLAISFPVWIMFTFMSNRYNTENTDRSEAAHCRAEGCYCCSFRQIPCSCHQKKKRKKKQHLSAFWVHFKLWSIFAIESNRIPNWGRAGFLHSCQ